MFLLTVYVVWFIATHLVGVQSIVISVSVCLCVCPCPNFMKFSVHVTCGRASFLLWRQNNKLSPCFYTMVCIQWLGGDGYQRTTHHPPPPIWPILTCPQLAAKDLIGWCVRQPYYGAAAKSAVS